MKVVVVCDCLFKTEKRASEARDFYLILSFGKPVYKIVGAYAYFG